MGGVAAATAIVVGWAGLAAIGTRSAAPSPAETEAVLQRLEVPRGFPSPSNADRVYYSALASPVEKAEVDDSFLRWSFREGLPARWRTAPPEGDSQPKLYRTATGLAVETTAAPLGYQLMAEARTLPAGRYVVVVQAGVVRGGVNLGVLDFDTNAWLSTRLFWSGQARLEGTDLVAPFSLPHLTRVQVVLANWARIPRRSLWEVREVSLARAVEERAATTP